MSVQDPTNNQSLSENNQSDNPQSFSHEDYCFTFTRLTYMTFINTMQSGNILLCMVYLETW